ncbi:transporter substrate-binding domain-containing protein [Thalassomonas haliotis]|uniref:Transporter substrate-binding domain-containing protein n=1 Tax=Thalassomonas haliotis TaxID=485448 RepID=A0ABY7VKY2_9GAMM|nr:transporter substrate-binding domain-containing protein [Thalassomonas haliotis]
MLLIITLVLSTCPFAVLAKENSPPPLVSYVKNGKVVKITGEITADGYRFNSQSKKTINLATLQWPPYIGEHLCNKGWVFQYAVALLAQKGYQINIHFYPWARAVRLVELGAMDILFPEYFIEANAPSDNIKGKSRRDLLELSKPYPGGEISFLKRKKEQDNFQGKLKNLIGEKIGVVRGYQNTPEFDAMMDAGLFDIVETVDDLQLMKMLAAKRVNLIIGDPLVLRHTVEHSSLSRQDKESILQETANVLPSLQYNHLYFAVSKKAENWQQLLVDLNQGIAAFEQSGETQRIVSNASHCFQSKLFLPGPKN